MLHKSYKRSTASVFSPLYSSVPFSTYLSPFLPLFLILNNAFSPVY